ncbi:hypothetical protein N7513_004550 [Penicillium frequentans]|nr:hypothetical protein N7513_004550 [Penicillium glabrum]
MGLGTDWALPSEPSIVQIISELNSHMPATSQKAASPDQSLSQLPIEKESVAEFGVLTLPILRITDEHRNRLLQALSQSQAAMVDTQFPSCHSLTRFVNGFFDGFYPHMPVVHIPTFKVDDCEPEIILAMAALGAQYRHEHRKAVLLFYAAKATLQYRETQGSIHEEPVHTRLVREARCALYLIAFATWQSETDIVREAFNLQSFLARCVRESQSENWEDQEDGLDWKTWVQRESDRRIKSFSFAILNLHGIAFGTPPILLSDELQLRLPCTCFEWIAPNRDKWAKVHKIGPARQLLLQEALSHLMKGSEQPNLLSSQTVPSPLANYILLHALIQRIMFVQQAFGSYDSDQNLLNDQKEAIRKGLHAWTSQWQRAPESSLDPRNPNGPVTFTSTALLGLAYVRLALNIGSYKILGSRDPQEIANKLLQMPRLPSGAHILPAILHATHALSIPITKKGDHLMRMKAV